MSNESNQPSSKPKIIVDSDWKEQVEKEKRAATEQPSSDNEADKQPEPPSPSDPAAASPDDATAAQSEASVPDTSETAEAAGDMAAAEKGKTEPAASLGSQQLPPPTFEVLVSMLFTQAMSALGQMPSPIDGKTEVNKPMAKHSIDMLDMLTTKTKGNLSEDESQMLTEALHALRMGYVNARE